MTKHLRYVLFVIGFMLLTELALCGCQNDPVTIYSRPVFSVTERIAAVDTLLSPLRNLQGFHISASSSFQPNTIIETSCAADGTFNLSLPRGIYDLTITKEDYGLVQVHNIVVDHTIDSSASIIAMMYQKPRVKIESIQYDFRPDEGSTLVALINPNASQFFTNGRYVKIHFYDLDPTLGTPNTSMEQILTPMVSVARGSISCPADQLSQQIIDKDLRGRKIYLQASLLNGPGYYDPITGTTQNDAEGPLSDVFSILIP